MSAYSLIIKLYHKVSWMGLSSGQDMNRVTFSVVAIMLLAAATTLPFVLNAGFWQKRRRVRSSVLSNSRRTTVTASSITSNCRRRDSPARKTCWPRGGIFWSRNEKTRPQQPLPLVNTPILPVCRLVKTSCIWLGHSSWYLQLAGKRILIDPVFSDYARAVLFINKAFPEILWNAQRMPEIDLLIISHDHYDHLDYATIKALMPKLNAW